MGIGDRFEIEVVRNALVDLALTEKLQVLDVEGLATRLHPKATPLTFDAITAWRLRAKAIV